MINDSLVNGQHEAGGPVTWLAPPLSLQMDTQPLTAWKLPPGEALP